MRAWPRFLGPMNLQKASGLKYGALFTLEGLFEMRLDLAKRVWSSPSPELTCFGEAPSAGGALFCFFPQTCHDLFGGDLVCYTCNTFWSPSPGPAWHGPFLPVRLDCLV